MNYKLLAIFIFLFSVVHEIIRIYLLSWLPEYPQRVHSDEIPIFNKNFTFGVSTAAYQIEENVPPSNWFLWEHVYDKNGKQKAPTFPLKCKGIEHFYEDLQLIKEMGCTVYRLSFSWSRINPKPGVFDGEVMNMYREMLIKIRELGLEPFVTLWHFEHPAWLEERGGIKSSEFVKRYEEFAEYVISHIFDLCDSYHTINEPIGFISSSLFAGEFPPGKGSLKDIHNAIVNLMTCHAVGYHIIHKYKPNAKVSYAKNLTPFVPYHKWSLFECIFAYIINYYNSVSFDVFQTGTVRFLWMKSTIPNIKDTLDYISINHYYCIYININPLGWGQYNGVTFPFLSYGDSIKNDFGWGMLPSSLADSIRWVNKRWNPKNLSFIVSEHGCADETDIKRKWFLRESLVFLTQLQDDGINLTSYIHWTLTDNYEWAEGTKMKFGLAETNWETFERKLKPSAYLYRDIIAANKNA